MQPITVVKPIHPNSNMGSEVTASRITAAALASVILSVAGALLRYDLSLNDPAEPFNFSAHHRGYALPARSQQIADRVCRRPLICVDFASRIVENSIKGDMNSMNQIRGPKTKFESAHDHFEFEQWPFYNMSRLISLYHRRLDAALKPIGMDTPRWRVLSILGKRGTATVTQISDEAVMLMSTTAKIIQRMIAQDLVKTSASQKDARSVEVSLTPNGAEKLAAVQKRVGAVAARSFIDLSEADIDALNATTRKMYSNLEV